MRCTPLAADQQPAELCLKLLDGARQRRLRDVALLRGARKVQGLAKRNKIADLVQLHETPAFDRLRLPLLRPQCPVSRLLALRQGRPRFDTTAPRCWNIKNSR